MSVSPTFPSEEQDTGTKKFVPLEAEGVPTVQPAAEPEGVKSLESKSLTEDPKFSSKTTDRLLVTESVGPKDVAVGLAKYVIDIRPWPDAEE